MKCAHNDDGWCRKDGCSCHWTSHADCPGFAEPSAKPEPREMPDGRRGG